MTKAKFLIGAALVLAAALAPSLADARHNRHHRANYGGLPYPISFLHNYGPGLQPGTFAFYDGPSTILCRQGAAAYIGQDGRRHPCY
jgi:MoaA/NifB/PqqE/SkfB family radical SAM enzyme